MSKPAVLLLCSHNSSRSQMAHGWLKHHASKDFDVYSAGIEPGTLNPFAVKAMSEIGIDISDHTTNSVKDYLGTVHIHYLIIVCDKAAETCPTVWPGVLERHLWPFPDPSAVEGTDEEKLDAFRKVRDSIGVKMEEWLIEIGQISI